ncbi:MAG TPA: SPOR domain-containing protein [Flavobacteriales bacterium]|nr:SPOR domain-containing protein [Flavobacteriales bacterium]HIA11770.1 SPOR domain-containing protein [Flavobacteriales bacterium]
MGSELSGASEPSRPGLVGSETTPELSGSSITWEETQYYIVLGSYGTRAIAQQFFDNLDSKENALIVRTPQNSYEVIYGFRTEQEARDDLSRRSIVFPAAWISRKL